MFQRYTNLLHRFKGKYFSFFNQEKVNKRGRKKENDKTLIVKMITIMLVMAQEINS